MYQPELEPVLAQIKAEKLFDCEFTVTYLPINLHIDLQKLKTAVREALDAADADQIILLYGSKCHPEFDLFLQDYPIVRFDQSNCVELVMGKSLPAPGLFFADGQQLTAHGNTYYCPVKNKQVPGIPLLCQYCAAEAIAVLFPISKRVSSALEVLNERSVYE